RGKDHRRSHARGDARRSYRFGPTGSGSTRFGPIRYSTVRYSTVRYSTVGSRRRRPAPTRCRTARFGSRYVTARRRADGGRVRRDASLAARELDPYLVWPPFRIHRSLRKFVTYARS